MFRSTLYSRERLSHGIETQREETMKLSIREQQSTNEDFHLEPVALVPGASGGCSCSSSSAAAGVTETEETA
jgi:hypothetical protein